MRTDACRLWLPSALQLFTRRYVFYLTGALFWNIINSGLRRLRAEIGGKKYSKYFLCTSSWVFLISYLTTTLTYKTTAVVNVYTPVFVENENRYGSSVRRKNDSILKFWCFFYPFDYGNFIRYLINNKTNGYMRNLIFFLNVALGK